MREKINDRTFELQAALWRLAADHIATASTEAERAEAEREVCTVLTFLAAGAYVLHAKGEPCAARWSVNADQALADAVADYPGAVARGLHGEAA